MKIMNILLHRYHENQASFGAIWLILLPWGSANIIKFYSYVPTSSGISYGILGKLGFIQCFSK